MKNKNTYSLLINADSEEKGRSIFETAIYSFVVMATAVSVWTFASGAVVTPGMNRAPSPSANIAVEVLAANEPIVLAQK
jgi:hypothetical protein